MLPSWLRQEIPDSRVLSVYRNICKSLNIHTVCQAALCPNIGSCYKENCITFLILGDICTRNCSFCAVKSLEKANLNFDTFEPLNIAKAVSILGIDYCVITSVTRDDLADGGAGAFVDTLKEIRRLNSDIKIEILIPDFEGNAHALENVARSTPNCLAHNIETVPRLYKALRPKSDYTRSLNILSLTKDIDSKIITKSSLMLGLGETHKEVLRVIKDLFEAKCDILTIGQYLSPSKRHFQTKEYIHPDKFEIYRDFALGLGFKVVASSPLVRSSYKAKYFYNQLVNKDSEKFQLSEVEY